MPAGQYLLMNQSGLAITRLPLAVTIVWQRQLAEREEMFVEVWLLRCVEERTAHLSCLWLAVQSVTPTAAQNLSSNLIEVCLPVEFAESKEIVHAAIRVTNGDSDDFLSRECLHLLERVKRPTTQAQRPGPRDATIATATLRPGSLQRMVSEKTAAEAVQWGEKLEAVASLTINGLQFSFLRSPHHFHNEIWKR
jgi:hypothetical protein